jgi:YgiT-type zinc finger domain-containing protein
MILTNRSQLDATLGWVLDTNAHPAAYFIWLAPSDPTDLPAPLRGAPVIGSDGSDLLGRLQEAVHSTSSGVVVLRGGLSALSPSEKRTLDVRREQLLDLDCTLVFIESVDREPALRRDLPNVMSIVREHFRLVRPSWDDDDMWPAAAGPWGRFAARLPEIFTHGSIIFSKGKAHFKVGPIDTCPKCGHKPTRGRTQLTFRYAPATTQVQEVDAWVCQCGEVYVPGDIARAAHQRAFATS